ncbi:hypothetical protein [Cognatishimia sp. MH4019]|uniref:hypothetical protein n=1 Tax=Cognatishimia sp. MH4019 TaxID=2854030 RepID=UPI001CD3BE85|nr:hypothetical protein [Cognatishimia sp. MH4019]
MTTDQNDPLEGFFEAARDDAPQPSDILQARILADADAALAANAPPVRRRNRLRDVLQGLGGWPAMAGLVTATMAGVWIGISPPEMVETLIEVQTVEYLPGFDALLEEG